MDEDVLCSVAYGEHVLRHSGVWMEGMRVDGNMFGWVKMCWNVSECIKVFRDEELWVERS